jgi:hypothetical protein
VIVCGLILFTVLPPMPPLPPLLLLPAACENPGLPDWQLASKGLCE